MTCRVLIVDDDLMVLQALQRLLRSRRPSWHVAQAPSGAAALEELGRVPPDVVVLDYRMAGMNGLELARAIGERQPGTPCIMLTGFADLEAVMAGLNEAVLFRFFQKPCPSEQLIDAIESAQAQRDQTRGAAAALDRLPLGALLVDRGGRVLRANAAAARLLDGAGAPGIDGGGWLRGMSPTDTEALRAAIARASTNPDAITVALRRADRRPIAATLCGLDGRDQAVAIYLIDPETPPSPSPSSIGDLYGLTPAEARLAAALARGLTLETAAVELGVTLTSARTYLKTVFAKMGVCRQAELVRQVLAGALAVPT